MNEEGRSEVTPVQSGIPQPIIATVQDMNDGANTPPIQATTTQVDQYKKRIASSSKWFKILGITAAIGICLTVVLGIAGLTSNKTDFVNVASNIVGIAAIPLGIVAGLWYSQIFRYSINTYDQQRSLSDSRAQKRYSAFKHLKLCLYISLGTLVFSPISYVPTRLISLRLTDNASFIPVVIRGVSALLVLVVFILTITSLIHLFRNRERNYIHSGVPNKRTHWVLRWLFFVVAFSNMGVAVASVLIFLYLQLYSHWCNLTNSKCY